jgi:hypothetical protein
MESAGIYVILSSIGSPGRFHWGIYLKLSQAMGFVAHARHPTESLSSLEWELEYSQNFTLESSVSLILALKVGTLQTSRYRAYENALRDPTLMEDSDGEDFTCRIWVKRALRKLDEDGFIKCDDVDAVETEAVDLASEFETDFAGDAGFLIRTSQCST